MIGSLSRLLPRSSPLASSVGRRFQSEGLNFQLSGEQAALQELARDFARKEVAPRAAHYDETGLCCCLWLFVVVCGCG